LRETIDCTLISDNTMGATNILTYWGSNPFVSYDWLTITNRIVFRNIRKP